MSALPIESHITPPAKKETLATEQLAMTLSPLNPWKQAQAKDRRVRQLLQKRPEAFLSSSPLAPIETSVLDEREGQLLVSSGDDGADVSKDNGESNAAAVAHRNTSVARFICSILRICSNEQSKSQSKSQLRYSLQLWKYFTQLDKQETRLLECQDTNTLLSLKTARAEADAMDQRAAGELQLDATKRQLADEQVRNSSLQDRLISMEKAHALSIEEHSTQQQLLSTQLDHEKKTSQELQESLSQQEKQYSQSLQAITTDVMQFTKVTEAKDTTISDLQISKNQMESEINELKCEIKDLVTARDQYTCLDCAKMKSFFDTMQHDMQHLMERKVQLEHENAQIPALTDQLASMKAKLTTTQLDFTRQVSEMQQNAHTLVPQDTVTEMEVKHKEMLQSKDIELAAKEHTVQECLRELTSAKDALMEYDDKCVELGSQLSESQAK